MHKFKSLKSILFIVGFVILGFSSHAGSASAANRYWVGGASNTNWSGNYTYSSISTSGGTYGLAITPDGSRVYGSDGSTIRTSDNTFLGSISNVYSPVDITITPNGSYAYVSNQGNDSVSVIRTSDNTIVNTISVGSAPYGIAITPNGSYVYVVNSGDATVSVIRTSDNTLVSTVSVGASPINVAITPDGAYAYVTNDVDNSVSVIRTSDNTVVNTVNVGTNPWGISITPNGSYVYVANGSDATVSVIRISDNTVVNTITVDNSLSEIEISPSGLYVYVISGSNLYVIRTSDNTVVDSIPAGSSPTGLVVTPDGLHVYVSDSGAGINVIDTSTNTNTSLRSNWSKTSGGMNNAPVPTANDNVFFDANSGSSNSVISVNFTINSLDMTGYTGTLTHSNNKSLTIAGSATFSPMMTYTIGGTGCTIVMSVATGNATLTTGGKTLCPLQKSAAGTLLLGDDLNLPTTASFIVLAGTFDANGKNLTIGKFDSNTAVNARTITMGTGVWTLTGNATTVWNTQDSTGLTLNRGNPVILSYSGGTGTRTINSGVTSGTESNAPDFSITAGTDIVTTVSSGKIRHLNFAGFSGTFSNVARSIYGNLTISPTMTVSAGTNVTTFAGTSGTQTITSNGKTLDFPLTFNGTGGTFLIGDNLSVGATTSRAVTLTAGTLNLNGKTLTNFGTFIPGAGSTTRSVAFNGGMYNNTSTAGGNTWSYTGTNFTTSGAGTIKISGSTTNNRTFTGGGATYPDILFTNATSNGQFIIAGSNTFNSFTCVDTNGQTIKFAAGTTNTFSRFNVTGAVGNLITLNSTTTATFALVKSGTSIVNSDYLNIQHAVVTPANTWYAGANSTDNQATSVAGSGWVFTAPPADTTAPVTTPSSTGGLYGSGQSITLSCDDTGGYGCDSIYYTLDGSNPTIASATYSTPLSILNNTITTLKYFARDFASNTESIHTETYTTDSLSPTATIEYSTPLPVKAGSAVRITATFNKALLDSPVVQISISGRDTLSATDMTKIDTTHYYYDYTVSDGAEGTNTISLSVGTDALGHVVTATPMLGSAFGVYLPRTFIGGSISGGGGGVSQSSSLNTPTGSSPTISATISNPVGTIIIRTIKIQSKGEDVKILQNFLKLPTDGVFGPKTKQALIKFQKANKLTPDGVVGPKTRALINKGM